MGTKDNTMDGHRAEWIVIGISGVTCGGKTTLATRLRRALAPARVLHQDQYFLPDHSPRHTRCKGLDHNNYDILSALDMDQMYQDVLATMGGEDRSLGSSEDPDDNSVADGNSAAGDKFTISGKKFLVVEGFTVLNFKPILELCDLRYYLVLEYGECAARRALRLYEPPDVAGYFDTCVWPEHRRYRAEIEKDHRIRLLDGTRHDAFDIVMEDLRAMAS